MRIRFFWITFFVLTIVAVAATALNSYLIHRERLELVDRQVRDTATALLDSDINGVREIQFERVDEILSEELGETRIGKFFIIRNDQGKVLFESAGFKLLPIVDVPREPQWITYREKGKFIRVLNLKLPRIPDRTLQVGIVVDISLIEPSMFSPASLVFIGCILLLGLAVAWGLTSTLMKPISRLVDFVTAIGNDPKAMLPSLPPEFTELKLRASENDELLLLLESFSRLVDKVNRGQKLARAWSYQMAHELKTPLAIAEGEILLAKRGGELKPETAGKIMDELLDASETVTAFLSWAELEGTRSHEELFAVSATKAVRGIRDRLANRFPGRIEVDAQQDFHVLAGAQHLELLLMNVIQNALLYSPATEKVLVKLSAPKMITVSDHGGGLPARVLERLGEPFNRGDRSVNVSQGNGLGLAYVNSVCKLYGWKMAVDSTAAGTTMRFEFDLFAGASTAKETGPVQVV